MMSAGHGGPRAKAGSGSYYKGRYHIAFYKQDGGNEYLYAGFDNVAEICKHLGLPTDPPNLNKVHQALYKCLNAEGERLTKLIDGIPLKACLIDMAEDEEDIARREEDMKRFVKINSNIDIEVYPSLRAVDATNPNSPMADRLSAKPDWVCPILIKKGIWFYPAQIKEWPAVKSLERNNRLSISEEADEVPAGERAACEAMIAKLERAEARRQQPQAQQPKKAKAEAKEPKEAKAEQAA